MKLNSQEKYFINGVILLILAILCVTFLPLAIKAKTSFIIQNYIYYQIEFFVLCATAIYFLFSPKYYFHQIICIILSALSYFLFVKLY